MLYFITLYIVLNKSKIYLNWCGFLVVWGVGEVFAYVILGLKPNEPDRYRSRAKERRIYDLKRNKSKN